MIFVPILVAILIPILVDKDRDEDEEKKRKNDVDIISEAWYLDTMTLVRVAEDAGVALNTARKALQGDPTVRDYLRERVLASAAKLEYRPNLVARGLKQQRLDVVPISAPELDTPYFGALALHLSDELAAAGLEPALCTDPRRLFQLNAKLNTCGSILAYAVSAEMVAPLAQHQKVVVINAPHKQLANVGFVQIDFAPAYRRATELLLGQGRTRIAVLSEVCVRAKREAFPYFKFDGVQDVLTDAGLDTVRPAHAPTFVDSRELIDYLDTHRDAVDAVICENDQYAASLFAMLTARGCRVGEEVFIVGCDANLPLAGCWSIRVDTKEIADMAVSRLREMLDGTEHVEPLTTVPTLVGEDGKPI